VFKEFKVPPTTFFAAGFILVLLFTNLILEDYGVRFGLPARNAPISITSPMLIRPNDLTTSPFFGAQLLQHGGSMVTDLGSAEFDAAS
jgi:hypothetical protein